MPTRFSRTPLEKPYYRIEINKPHFSRKQPDWHHVFYGHDQHELMRYAKSLGYQEQFCAITYHHTEKETTS
jgi:hypothetical protein